MFEATFTKENFSTGKGKMTYNHFARLADSSDIFQAIWVAKWIGCSLNVVRSFVRLYRSAKNNS